MQLFATKFFSGRETCLTFRFCPSLSTCLQQSLWNNEHCSSKVNIWPGNSTFSGLLTPLSKRQFKYLSFVLSSCKFVFRCEIKWKKEIRNSWRMDKLLKKNSSNFCKICEHWDKVKDDELWWNCLTFKFD